MAANNKNDLKDEEIHSGFGAGDRGDETFLLEMKEEYPGVLPFDPFKPGKSESAPHQQNPANSQENTTPDGEASVWDMFMDSPQTMAGIDSGQAPVQDLSQSDTPATTEDDGSADTLNDQSPDEPGSNSVDMDNDFLSMLKSELESSRKNQEARKSLENDTAKHFLTPEENDAMLKEFVAPEDMGEASFIDLALIEAEHPSSYLYNETDNVEQASESEPEPAAEFAPPVVPAPIKPKEKKNKKVKPEKDENQDKKLGYWSIVILSSIAALLMVTIGFGVYMYLFNEDLFRKSLGIESLNTKKHNIEKNKPGIKKSVSQPKPLDSLKSVQTDAQKAPGSNSANQPNQLTGTEAKGRDVNNVSGPMQEPARTVATAPERKTQDNKPAIAMNVPKTQAHPVYHNKPESKPGSNGKTEFKPESKDKPFASKIEKPKPDIKTGTNNNAVKPNTANKKNLAMASTAKTNSETNSQKTASTEKVKEVYTVQVYSTPSREDAEEWLRRLQAKNIRDAFISPQRVRDDVWYRVRFGAYESREEAKSAALRLGFSQSWIDRVR